MLKARKKISRREIKEDPLVTSYVKTQIFLRKHSKTIHIVLIAIVVIATYIIIDMRSKNAGDIRGEAQIVMAEQLFFSKAYDRAIVALEPISQEFRGTSAAGRAVFYLADAHYEKGDYDTAMKYYQQYLDDYGQISYFKASSQAGIAACLENKGEYEQAANAYEKAAFIAGDIFSKPFHLKNAARCYKQAGQVVKARSIYQKILDEYPDAAFKDEVTYQLNAM